MEKERVYNLWKRGQVAQEVYNLLGHVEMKLEKQNFNLVTIS